MKNFILSALTAIGLITGCNAQSQVKVLVPEAFITAVEGDTTAVILDVRRPSEYAEGHLAKAINIDWLDQEAFSKALPTLDKRRTYYVYCRSGRRSNAAATKMQDEGFKVFDMAGGYLRWTAEQRPVVK